MNRLERISELAFFGVLYIPTVLLCALFGALATSIGHIRKRTRVRWRDAS